jgi:isopentenyl-diphosphate Delta-isomerase
VIHEDIVLVDETGQPIGVAEKFSSHHATTPLHLAFSCYIFNGNGQLLVTQRAHSKKVWPGVWTNSVCGHPAPDEPMIGAIRRRLNYELGMTATEFTVVLPDYRYRTPPFKGVIENEFCPVYVARATGEPRANPEEVEAWKWMRWQEYVDASLVDTEDRYSWWTKDQLRSLVNHPIILQYAHNT